MAIFETAKIFIYVSVFLDHFKGEHHIWKMVIFLVLSVASVGQTYMGATPLVYNYKKAPKMIDQSDMALFYKQEIASLDKQIAHLHENDDKSYTMSTAKKVEVKQKKKNELAIKLEAEEAKRAEGNEQIEVMESGLVTMTSSLVLRIALWLNLFSAIIFAPFQAHFFYKSRKNFKIKESEGEDEKEAVGNTEIAPEISTPESPVYAWQGIKSPPLSNKVDNNKSIPIGERIKDAWTTGDSTIKSPPLSQEESTRNLRITDSGDSTHKIHAPVVKVVDGLPFVLVDGEKRSIQYCKNQISTYKSKIKKRGRKGATTTQKYKLNLWSKRVEFLAAKNKELSKK